MYRFYGWEKADVTDGGGKTPRDLYDALLLAWSAQTCAPRMRDRWSADDPTVGQCSVTSFLAQDLFGGEVWGIPLGDGNYHCFNKVGTCVFDLTSEQFGAKELNYRHAVEQTRHAHFSKDEKHRRYELLRDTVLQAW